jgi:UDP-2-acetamido-2,6-beta-L-arabino-hexul-4-ose reductase
MKLLVTGAQGFIGRNLTTHLRQNPAYEVWGFDQQNSRHELETWLAQADFVFHLAGVNRPQTEEEFQTGNVDLTAQICDYLQAEGKATPLLLSSSIQADRDNPYGQSKHTAEQVVKRYAKESGATVFIYRLTNVFGKWCRPNYNSVVATFCHNIAHDLPITISNRANEIDLVHVDDVVNAFVTEMGTEPHPHETVYREANPTRRISLGELADLLYTFQQSRQSLFVPNFADSFVHKLYGTYLSYLETDNFAYDLTKRSDQRGSLAEFVKSEPFGQIFVSRTHPGITRGHHFHHLKTEKFLVLEGKAIIRFRHIHSEKVIEYPVDGEMYRVVDIPPGYTHSIENIGEGTLVTLFWASEIFDPARADTIWQEV